MTRIDLLQSEVQHYLALGLTLGPLKFRTKKPLVRWKSWKPTSEELRSYFAHRANVGVLCGEKLAAIDCDSAEMYLDFISKHKLPPDCPIIKTGGGL